MDGAVRVPITVPVIAVKVRLESELYYVVIPVLVSPPAVKVRVPTVGALAYIDWQLVEASLLKMIPFVTEEKVFDVGVAVPSKYTVVSVLAM